MVTAIVIPIICIYFYWLTKKELQESHEKWMSLKNVPEEAMLIGRVINVSESRQRFSYHQFIYVLDIKIKGDYTEWNVKKIIPIDGQEEIPTLQKDKLVRVYGNWKENHFLVSRIERLT